MENLGIFDRFFIRILYENHKAQNRQKIKNYLRIR